MRLMTVVGARPQFIKAGPVNRAIDAHNARDPSAPIEEIVVHTGQHYDEAMSQVFFDQLRLRQPAHHLGVGSGGHGEQTGAILQRLEAVVLQEKPDQLLVYGDTNSTLAGALVAAKLHIPVVHVEAGLRSYNRRMPEEVNRVLTDQIASLLICPSQTAVDNLAAEGIRDGVLRLGDVMHDSVLYNARIAARELPDPLQRLGLVDGHPYALATVHRAENTDAPDKLRSIFRALGRVATDELPVILPLHPRTRKALVQHGLSPDQGNLRLIEPVSYLEMLVLERRARLILTDSGGVQKEAYWFAVPCVTLRDETEWVETVETGWNQVVGSDGERIIEAARGAASGAGDRDAYGDGHSAERIVEALRGGERDSEHDTRTAEGDALALRAAGE